MQLEQCVTEAVAFEERVRAESQVVETGTAGRRRGMEGRWRRHENGMWGQECNMHEEIHEKTWGLFWKVHQEFLLPVSRDRSWREHAQKKLLPRKSMRTGVEIKDSSLWLETRL